MLKASDLTKAHDGDPLFDGLSFVLGDGERAGLVGPNGVGKSTLLRLLAGVDRPDRGTVSTGPGERIGWLPQEAPDPRTTLGELLGAAHEVTGSTGTVRWVDSAALVEAGVEPWMQLPIWLPAGEDHETMHQADVSKAMAAALRIRPLAETVADTWEWLQSIGGVAPQRPDRPPVGLDAARERELITQLIPN